MARTASAVPRGPSYAGRFVRLAPGREIEGMPYTTIVMERRGSVGTLTLHRPEKLNALSQELMQELPQGIEEWNRDPSVGAIVITGAGRAFCAGADLSRLPMGDAAQATPDTPRQPGALE